MFIPLLTVGGAIREELVKADFQAKARATAASVPQFATVAAQYREALQKMLVQVRVAMCCVCGCLCVCHSRGAVSRGAAEDVGAGSRRHVLCVWVSVCVRWWCV